MEQTATLIATLLLVATPVLLLVKVLHAVTTRRVSFAVGRRGAAIEAVAWPLLGAIDSHTAALWSTFTLQAEDLCSQYRPDLGPDVYLSGGTVFEFPVRTRCVWAQDSVVVTPTWPAVATALFLATALVVAASLIVRARRRTPTDHT